MNSTADTRSNWIGGRVSRTLATGFVVAAMGIGIFGGIGGVAHAEDNDIDWSIPCHANGQSYPGGSLIKRGGVWYACVEGQWVPQTDTALTNVGSGNVLSGDQGVAPTGGLKGAGATHVGTPGMSAK